MAGVEISRFARNDRKFRFDYLMEVGKLANKEQLAILKQGVAAWNKWREENPDAKIDLRGAKLDGLNLRGINFYKAEMIGIKINNCNLSNANLIGSKICVSLHKRIVINILLAISSVVPINMMIMLDFAKNFFDIFIILTLIITTPLVSLLFICFLKAKINKSNLDNSRLDNSYIKHVNFHGTSIVDTSFKNAYVDFVSEITLDDDKVRDLLVTGKGKGRSLRRKNLQGAHLVDADLRNMDLREANLELVNLRGADITGAKIWSSKRKNWVIENIRCEYVYWDEAGDVRTPPDRDFRPGEFEEVYKQLPAPTFEYVFAQDTDPLIIDKVVQTINEQHKEVFLELINFYKNEEQINATFTVCQFDFIENTNKYIEKCYQSILESQRRINEDILKKQSKMNKKDASKSVSEQQELVTAVLELIENQNKLIHKISSLDGAVMGDTYINYGQAAAMGKNSSASGNTFFQQITAELSRLHEAMRTAAANPAQNAAADEVAKAEQAARQQNEPKMRQHLKNAGKFAVDCVQKIGTEALAEYLKKMTLGM